MTRFQQSGGARLADVLERLELKIVFAESCTAGLASALLAAVPGISKYHCGALVTYREQSKQSWLHVSPELLVTHTAVSADVTAAMALGALQATPEANVSAAITGHLGPGAPPSQDGVCFLAVALRRPDTAPSTARLVTQRRLQLTEGDRVARQHQAARALLETAASGCQHAC